MIQLNENWSSASIVTHADRGAHVLIFAWALRQASPVVGSTCHCARVKLDSVTSCTNPALENAIAFPTSWAARLGSRAPRGWHPIASAMAGRMGKVITDNLGSARHHKDLPFFETKPKTGKLEFLWAGGFSQFVRKRFAAGNQNFPEAALRLKVGTLPEVADHVFENDGLSPRKKHRLGSVSACRPYLSK